MHSLFYLTSSWDDGALTDIKLARLLRKYKIPATLYIPINNQERPVLSRNDIKELSDYFEIGAHTLSHVNLRNLNDYKIQRELLECKRILESIINKPVVSFCYPKGMQNQNIKQYTGMAGFEYARTTKLFATAVGDKLLAPTTVHVYDHHPLVYLREGMSRRLFYYLLYKNKFSLKWDKLALASLDYCLNNGGVFHIWGHSWEIEKYNNWERLESIFSEIAKRCKNAAKGSNYVMMKHYEKNKFNYYKFQKANNNYNSYNTIYYKNEFKYTKKLVKKFDLKGNNVLDLGCGVGRHAGLFKKCRYQGVDNSAQLIRYARKKFSTTNVKFNISNVNSMDNYIKLPKQDLILIWGLFEDETNPFVKLERLQKILKKNGRIIFTLHNSRNILFSIIQYLKSEWLKNNFPYTSFSPQFMRMMLSDYQKNHSFISSVQTFGVLPPVNKSIPGVNLGDFGNTIIVCIDKK